MKIEIFRGQYYFLSNFEQAIVHLDGEQYPSVEHAFQAAKSLDPIARRQIRRAESPGEAKRLGRRVALRSDWEQVKIELMYELLVEKFSRRHMSEQLLATGDAEIIEGNTWHDVFWGVCTCSRHGSGENMLGKLLMRVRAKLEGQ